MTQRLPRSVSNAAVFGSYARGDFDSFSDLDVIVVVKDGSGTTSEQVVAEAIEPLFLRRPSISFYGERKLRSMFQSGHLFAWHLYRESCSIFEFPDLQMTFGEPKRYDTAMEDIIGLMEILSDVDKQIQYAPQNAIFEMGILYVCARNIAMSASWHLARQAEFGRYSPFSLPDLPFPLSRTQYEIAMQCRMASTRGEVPADVNSSLVIATTSAMVPWAHSVVAKLRSAL